jgi:nucleoside-diphosphate-sugar epimerase
VQRLVITGSSGALGQRLVALLAEPDAPQFREIVAIDRVPLPFSVSRPSGVRAIVRDLTSGGNEGLAELFAGADVVVHLASDGHDDAGPVAAADEIVTQRVFDAASAADIGHVVVVSSAVVYGAWSDNPVPLTEDAPVRINPGFGFADGRQLLETQAGQWCVAATSVNTATSPQAVRTLTILRPSVSPLATGSSGWLARAVRPSLLDQLIAPLPPLQFVHIDDIASAIVHAAQLRLNGIFNVAPDGWLTGEQVPPLLGTVLSIPATGRVHDLATVGARLLRRVRGNQRPKGAEPWSRHPWVIANDRLKATGWVPLSTSAEVIVASRRPSKWSTLFARKRQEATIAAVGTVSLGVIGALFGVWKRIRSPR